MVPLPPLSDVIRAWLDLIKDGELVSNGASSLYRAGAGRFESGVKRKFRWRSGT